MAQSKLSKMQKCILKELEAAEKDKYIGITWGFSRVSTISFNVAKHFDKDGNKIFDKRRAKKELMVKVLTANKENKEEYERVMRQAELVGILLNMHRNDLLIHNRFSAAFSRALKRLEKRRLIYRINGFSNMERQMRLSEYPNDPFLYFEENGQLIKLYRRRTNYIKLTEEGKKIAESIIL